MHILNGVLTAVLLALEAVYHWLNLKLTCTVHHSPPETTSLGHTAPLHPSVMGLKLKTLSGIGREVEETVLQRFTAVCGIVVHATNSTQLIISDYII
jgi:hypothetical protein